MIKSISFIVLTQFFHFNELKILRQPDYTIFKLNQLYIYSVLTLKNIKCIYQHFNQIMHCKKIIFSTIKIELNLVLKEITCKSAKKMNFIQIKCDPGPHGSFFRKKMRFIHHLKADFH